MVLLILPLFIFLCRRSPPIASYRYPMTSAQITFGGIPGRITAIPTGTVTIKRWHYIGVLPESTPYLLRFAAILFDWDWATPMPVWSYLIEHPEGTWLVDAGASPRYRDPNAWSFDPVSRKIVQSFIRLDIQSNETLRVRLPQLGVAPETLKAIVLTHQHVDHTGSVPDFPNADIWTSAAEDGAARSIGAMHPLWRGEKTRIRYVDSEGTPRSDGGVKSVFLTRDRRIEAVMMPGHTPGSLSVRISIDGGDVWMIGDTAFNSKDLESGLPTAGIHTDIHSVREHHQELRTITSTARIFPSHDPGVPERLRNLLKRN